MLGLIVFGTFVVCFLAGYGIACLIEDLGAK